MTRYRPEWLLSMEGGPHLISDGAVDVSDGQVVWSGPFSEAPQLSAPTQPLSGLLMPGFVNCHAHSPMVLLRGAGEGLAVDRWLTEVMWPREGLLTEEDVWWAMTMGAGELLANGITTSHEMYFFSTTVAEAAEAAGIRCVVTPPILTGEDLTRFGSWQTQLGDSVGLVDRYSDNDLITVGVGPHSAYAIAEAPLRAVTELAADRDLHVHLHVAEGRHEGDGVLAEHGVTVPRYLEAIGLLECRVVAAHGVWLTSDDITLFAGHRVGVAHCPMSNGKHASGIAPVAELRAAGVPVGIATDGPSSHDRLDPFEEMRAAIRMARLRSSDASAMNPADALTMATREAATVLGRDDLGALTAGCRADMLQVDTATLGPVTEPADLLTHLVYSATPAHVRSVWVGGRQVVADGTNITIDMDSARAEMTQRARRLAQETS
ncbi:amidohydrolase [soil metagenome]